MTREEHIEKSIRARTTVVIHGWMIKDLHLKGNELLTYAIIYGFSSDGVHFFFGGQRYLADWMSTTRQNASRIINTLLDKGYIAQVENEIKGRVRQGYVAVDPDTIMRMGVQSEFTDEQSTLRGEQSTLHRYKRDNIDYREFSNENSYMSLDIRDSDFENLGHTDKNTTIKSEVNYTIPIKSTTKQDKISLKNKIIHLIDEYTDNDGLRKSLYDFVEMREKQKKPVPTEHAMELLLKSLTNLCGNDTKRKTATVDKAIMKCWLSFYPLKQEDLMSMEERQTDLDDIF